MVASPLAFHAAAPGAWLNDPNALWHGPDGWTLLAQHRADAPAWQATGWGRFTSPDLLRWTWQGPAIPAQADAWAYSGCLLRQGEGLAAIHTAHAPGPRPAEWQVRRQSDDGGRSWSPAATLAIQPLPARRDPFVWQSGDGWHMLLARPCPWVGWEAAPPSFIEVWHAPDLVDWQLCGRIGPWDPPGVLWEVPILLPGADGTATLLISRVDRRDGRARCDVRWWQGMFASDGFVAATSGPLDLGPDFYAATVALHAPQLLIGWLSSWDIARALPWPGFAGGAISLPRRFRVEHGRVHVSVPSDIAAAFCRPLAAVPEAGCGVARVAGSFRLALSAADGRLEVIADLGTGDIRVVRHAQPPFDWAATHRRLLGAARARTLRLFLDGPLVELFIEPDGLALSAAISTQGPLSVSLDGGRFDWFGLSLRRPAAIHPEAGARHQPRAG